MIAWVFVAAVATDQITSSSQHRNSCRNKSESSGRQSTASSETSQIRHSGAGIVCDNSAPLFAGGSTPYNWLRTDAAQQPRKTGENKAKGSSTPARTPLSQYAAANAGAGLTVSAAIRVPEQHGGVSMVDAREVMNIRQASQYLGVSPDTLYKYVSEERIPAFKLGNRWKFKKSLLDSWMEAQSLSPAVPRPRKQSVLQSR
jgi:excisionase family DNA binding protein